VTTRPRSAVYRRLYGHRDVWKREQAAFNNEVIRALTAFGEEVTGFAGSVHTAFQERDEAWEALCREAAAVVH